MPPTRGLACTQACVLTGNWTSDLLVPRPALSLLSHTSQASKKFLELLEMCPLYGKIYMYIFLTIFSSYQVEVHWSLLAFICKWEIQNYVLSRVSQWVSSSGHLTHSEHFQRDCGSIYPTQPKKIPLRGRWSVGFQVTKGKVKNCCSRSSVFLICFLFCLSSFSKGGGRVT